MKKELDEEIKTFEPFIRLVQPLTEKEITALKNKLLSSSDIPIIKTWQGYHLADQTVYQICLDEHIPFKITELSFENWKKAAVFICSTQLATDTLTPEYRKYLIGQKFQFLFMESDETDSQDPKYNVAAPIAKELKISVGTVLKYNSYALAINDLFDVNPECALRILLRKIRVSHENVVELSRLMPEEKKSIAQVIVADNVDKITLSYIRSEAKWSHVKTQAPVSRRERKEIKMRRQAGIQCMPLYDPDAEVNSLCMTMESWISSLQRVRNSENFPRITNKASLQFMKKLSFLEHTINDLQDSLVERKDYD